MREDYRPTWGPKQGSRWKAAPKRRCTRCLRMVRIDDPDHPALCVAPKKREAA